MVKVEGRLDVGRSEVGKESGVALVVGAAKGFRVWWRDKHRDAIFTKIFSSFSFGSETIKRKHLTESNRPNRNSNRCN